MIRPIDDLLPEDNPADFSRTADCLPHDVQGHATCEEVSALLSRLPTTRDLFDLSHTMAAPLLTDTRYPHEALPRIHAFLLRLVQTLGDDYREIFPGVYASRHARIAADAVISAPCIIGAGAEIRTGAYLRGDVLIGEEVTVGNSTEVKNAILFDGVQVPHYNYVGDSILGYRAHMGAGAIASNYRLDHGNVRLSAMRGSGAGEKERKYDTGLRKCGTMLGDRAEIGCNSVLCPGSSVGRDSLVYPLCTVRGIIDEGKIYDGVRIRDRRLPEPCRTISRKER